MLGVYTAYDMHLRNIATLHLASTSLDIIERHSPSIGVALTTTKRAELTVEEADIRWLKVDIAVVVYLITTRLALTLHCQLAKQPQWCLTP